METNSKIFVAGHKGLVGSAIIKKLTNQEYQNVIIKSKSELDLSDQNATLEFFRKEQPEYVFLSAAKVGGILANATYPAEFIYDNILIEANVINSSYITKVKKLLFLGSSCIYPKFSKQPIKEEYLLSGFLEPTNEAYAIAKIAGIKLCQAYNTQYSTNYISVMPTNLYGFNDNFDLNNSHVIPAFMKKFHEAKKKNLKEVILWGTGQPMREFLYSEDLADACLFLMNDYDEGNIINVGTGNDISINDVAYIIKDIVGFDGTIAWDVSKPDGTPKKLLDVSKLRALGWKEKHTLKEGLLKTYNWYLSEVKD